MRQLSSARAFSEWLQGASEKCRVKSKISFYTYDFHMKKAKYHERWAFYNNFSCTPPLPMYSAKLRFIIGKLLVREALTVFFSA